MDKKELKELLIKAREIEVKGYVPFWSPSKQTFIVIRDNEGG